MAREIKAGRLKALLVEDELLIAMDLEDWLTELGFDVIGPFRRSSDALDTLDTSDALGIDFAVLDFLLEDANSGAVADRLSQLGVPYVFITGCHNLLRQQTRHRAPMLEKPITRVQMTQALGAMRASLGAARADAR